MTDANFGRVTSDDLIKPSTWAGHPVDARFRMHRPASHLAEHTTQCEKVLHALGLDPAEARQLVRAIWAARGRHERLSDPPAAGRRAGRPRGEPRELFSTLILCWNFGQLRVPSR